MAPHTHRNHQGDPTLPCSTCRKRHVRAIARSTSGSERSTRRKSASSSSPFSKSGVAIVLLAFASGSSLATGSPDPVTVTKDVALQPSSTLEKSSDVSKLLIADASFNASNLLMSHQAGFRKMRLVEGPDVGLFDHLEGAELHEEDEDHLHGEDEAELHDDEDRLRDTDEAGLLEEDEDYLLDGKDDHDEDEAGLRKEEDYHDETHEEEDHHNEEEDHDEDKDHLKVEEDNHDQDEDEHLRDKHEDRDHESEGDDHDHSSHAQESSSYQTFQEETIQQSLPWGKVIGATLIVNLATLTGLLLVVLPAMHRGYLKYKGKPAVTSESNHGRFVNICIPAFAVGALMATAAFLVFPEAMHLIEGGHGSHEGEDAGAHSDHRSLQDDHDDHDDHSEEGHKEEGSSESFAAARFGMALLGGFLLPMVLSIMFHHSPHPTKDDESVPGDDVECASCGNDVELDSCDCDVEIGVVVGQDPKKSTSPNDIIHKVEDESLQDMCECCEDVEDVQAKEPLVTKTFIDKSLIASVLIGDFFCNFTDGLFIGAAFLSCSWGTAVTIMLMTLFHELPQEFADFVLLTQYAGLSIGKACLLNFTTGLAVTLGGLVVLAGSPSEVAVGVMLTMAGGAYINIAACETIPRVKSFVKSRGDSALTVTSFIVGAVPIGLVLLKHEHCG